MLKQGFYVLKWSFNYQNIVDYFLLTNELPNYIKLQQSFCLHTSNARFTSVPYEENSTVIAPY